MRLFPAQIAVYQICGEDPTPYSKLSMRQQLMQGRESLRQMTGVDCEFDLQKWHDHLKESREGGYTWNRSIDLPKIMKQALANQEWIQTVDAIRNAAMRRANRP